MTKKIFIYLFLILFTTSISAEEIIMRCGKNTYKYIKGETADNILWKNSYWTKNKYEQWCSDKIKQKNTESREGVVLIVKDKKGTCMVKKHKYKYEGKFFHYNNGIDRKKLGEIVFSDPKAKADLEAVIHPLVRYDRNKFISRMMSQRRKIAVVDIPLLYETGSETICDMVICSWAPYFLQKQRALKRFGMSEEKFNAILKQQIPQREKMILADFCLPTGLGKAYSYRLLIGWLSNQNKKHLTRKF